ncbi:MAG: PAS domain S-box protein [Chitinophagaceae bacterium]|nr:PAS domain S-box protein [Chitinophagaceae bacterium]
MSIDKITTALVSDATVQVDDLPCALMIFSDKGTIRKVNQKLLDLLGYARNDLAEQSIEKIFTLPTRLFYQTHIFPLLKLSTAVEEIFVQLRAKDGTQVPTLLYGNTINNSGDDEYQFIFVSVWQRKKYEEEIIAAREAHEKAVVDNKELREAKEQLELNAELLDRQVQRLRQINVEYESIGKIISHDFQEPIRKIGLSVDILGRKNEPWNKENYLAKIQQSLGRLQALTLCIDQFVSIDTTNETISEFDVADLIHKAVEQAKTETGISNIELSINVNHRIEGYPGLLTELFVEIIKNSITYRKENTVPEISITGQIAQYNHFRFNLNKYKYVDFLRLEIKDNGKGFDNRYKEYIFEMFKRLDFEQDGLGFGLTLVKKIVDKHFGTITASSIPGDGTSLVLTLPVRSNSDGMI